VVFAANDPRTPSQQQQAVARALERVAALPGVVAAAEATGLPTDGFRSDLEVPGRPSAERRTLRYQLCSQGYLKTFGVQLLRGRDFTDADIAGARRVAIVNETLAAAHFPGEDPIGRTIVVAGLRTVSEPIAEPVFEIVGVARDTRNGGLRGETVPAAFLPSTVTGFGRRLIAARTAADARLMIEPARRAVWSLDPGLAITQAQPLDEVLRERYYAQPRFSLIVLVSFAVIGLLLVGVGVYGVMAYTVARQRQEIAVRIALGASRGAVHALVLRTGVRLLAGGIAIGLLLSLAATRLIASQLWGTSPYDPLSLVLAVAVILAIGLFACYVPAARAVRIDPVAALRLD
jgi:putative ABC transport system permease protein